MKKITATMILALAFTGSFARGETIRIAIGTQDTTINCAAGGPLVRELHLLEKYLPHEGKYQDATYDIQWESQPTGGQLNTKFLANQLDIVQMADFPAVVGAASFASAGEEVRSLYIATLSGGITGAGNAILVPVDSPVQALSELKGKTISVPFVSTAHAALIRAVQNLGWDPNKDVNIIAQTPEVGGAALKAGQIDAHADFVPFGELYPFRGFARKILDGSAIGVTTTHGVQTRSDFAQKYPELVVAYLKATLEADRLLREDPEGVSEKLAQWTGVEAEIYYAFHGPNGIQTRDYTLKPEFVGAIQAAAETLKVLKKIPATLELSRFVDDRFIRQAAKETGLDYDARLKDYAPVPLTGNDFATGEAVTEVRDAGQLWVAGEPKVRLYKSIAGAFVAVAQLEKANAKVRVAFVHDRESGLKLLADKAWYVGVEKEWSAFLEKERAEKWAQARHGKLFSYQEARAHAL